MTDEELKQQAWEVFDAFRLGMRDHNVTHGPPQFCIDGSHMTAEVGGESLIIRLKYAEDVRGWFGPKRVWMSCGYMLNLNHFLHSPTREMREALIAIAQDSGVKLPLSRFLPKAEDASPGTAGDALVAAVAAMPGYGDDDDINTDSSGRALLWEDEHGYGDIG